MIRTIAACTICVVGVFSPLGPSRAPAPATDVGMASNFPAVSGNKGDRLPIHTEAIAHEIVAEVPELTARIAVAPPLAGPTTDRTQPKFIPRHWHDSTSSKYRIKTRTAADAKTSQTTPIDKPKQVSEVNRCSSDGLAPLLRNLNLQPRCE